MAKTTHNAKFRKALGEELVNFSKERNDQYKETKEYKESGSKKLPYSVNTIMKNEGFGSRTMTALRSGNENYNSDTFDRLVKFLVDGKEGFEEDMAKAMVDVLREFVKDE